jgi:hypothetical protein
LSRREDRRQQRLVGRAEVGRLREIGRDQRRGIVAAAIDGTLPDRVGSARVRDLPAEWARQRQMLGLIAKSS